MSNLKGETFTILDEVWHGGLFDHPETIREGHNKVFAMLKKHYEEKLAEQKECPKREAGKNHAWETHSTDSGEETFCTKCFVLKPFIDGRKAVLRGLLAEVI